MKWWVAVLLLSSCLYQQVVQPTLLDNLSDPPVIHDLPATELPEWVQRLVNDEHELVVVRRDRWDLMNRDVSRARHWMVRADQTIELCTVQP